MLLLRLLLCMFGLVAGLPPSLRAQETSPAKSQPASSGMGVSTGAPRSAVFDAQHRPITAGGFVEGAPVVFANITQQAGLGKFRHQSGTKAKSMILETPGSGVALLDYDGTAGWIFTCSTARRFLR